MKMNQNHNLFSFLSRGVTTTHPWCSVFILCLCFVFCSYSVSVSASQSNIPEMTDWQFAQALDAYAGLTDDQKDIADFLVGAQGYAYAGLSQSNLNSSFSSYSDTIQYVKDYGAKMWDQFNTHVDGVVQNGRNNLLAIKNDLSNFFGNSASYAKSRYESFSAWLGNVGIDYNSSSEFRVQFGKDQSQNNTDFYGDEGLYNWQFSSEILDPSDFAFTWNTKTMSGSYNQTYYAALNNIPLPHVKINFRPNIIFNFQVGDTRFSTYRNIFANLSNNSVYICDDYGNQFQGFACSGVLFSDYVETPGYYSIESHVMDLTLYSNLKDLFNDISLHPWLIIGRQSENEEICLSDFIDNLYVGYSWDQKTYWSSNIDLNLSPTSQYVTINAPVNTIYIDLNGFMRDLYDNPTIIYNYVINNSIDENGNPVDPSGFEPISKFPGIPDSGITIGNEFFKINGLSPIFGPGSYIDALWNNTKGLVLYIGDIFTVLTLDSIDGGGFAWVIYGAVSVGVIGGIFSKFLL